MAILKTLNKKSYDDDDALVDVIRYCTNTSFSGGHGITNVRYAAEQMQLVQDVFGKSNGRRLRHYILSFYGDEITNLMDLEFIAWKITAYYRDRYQSCYGIHLNTDNPHIHFVINTVDYNTGLKFTNDYYENGQLMEHVRQVLKKYQIDLSAAY